MYCIFKYYLRICIKTLSLVAYYCKSKLTKLLSQFLHKQCALPVEIYFVWSSYLDYFFTVPAHPVCFCYFAFAYLTFLQECLSLQFISLKS